MSKVVARKLVCWENLHGYQPNMGTVKVRQGDPVVKIAALITLRSLRSNVVKFTIESPTAVLNDKTAKNLTNLIS